VTGAVPPSDGHDVAAGDDLLAEQVAYYRRRASECDVTASGDVDAARARITRVVAALRPEHRLVKVFVHPGQTSARLHQLGWQGCIRQDGAEVAGQEALLGRRLATAHQGWRGLTLTDGGLGASRQDLLGL
jgi:hypothetical protein